MEGISDEIFNTFQKYTRLGDKKHFIYLIECIETTRSQDEVDRATTCLISSAHVCARIKEIYCKTTASVCNKIIQIKSRIRICDAKSG